MWVSQKSKLSRSRAFMSSQKPRTKIVAVWKSGSGAPSHAKHEMTSLNCRGLNSLAAPHSSKDPPSLAYWLFASPQLNSVRWCCWGRTKREFFPLFHFVQPMKVVLFFFFALHHLCSFRWLFVSERSALGATQRSCWQKEEMHRRIWAGAGSA